jgi:hypothetical protein
MEKIIFEELHWTPPIVTTDNVIIPVMLSLLWSPGQAYASTEKTPTLRPVYTGQVERQGK